MKGKWSLDRRRGKKETSRACNERQKLDREDNEALLGIFFGRLGVEVEGPLLDDDTLSPNAHPWAPQLKVDLQSLKDVEPGREFIQAWQGNMRKLVMDEECRTLFCDIDLGELHMRALYDAKCSVWQSAHLRDHAERETDCSFECSFTPDVNFVRPRGGD